MLFSESENILSHKLHFQNKNAWVLQALSAKEKHRLIDTVPHFLALENSTHWKQLQNTKQTIFFFVTPAFLNDYHCLHFRWYLISVCGHVGICAV